MLVLATGSTVFFLINLILLYYVMKKIDVVHLRIGNLRTKIDLIGVKLELIRAELPPLPPPQFPGSGWQPGPSYWPMSPHDC